MRTCRQCHCEMLEGFDVKVKGQGMKLKSLKVLVSSQIG